MTRYTQVRVEHSGRTTRITLDRVAEDNALSSVLLAEIDRALDEAESAQDCRIVELRGRSGLFCTGMDFTEAHTAGAEARTTSGDGAKESARAFHALLARLTTTPRLTVATVDGTVLGGGVGLAAACDLVHVSDRSTFALPEALWGLLPCVVLPFLMRRVGFQRAYAMTLTTLPVDASTACTWGLADEVYEDGRDPFTRLAFRVGRMDASAVGDIKRYFGRLIEPPAASEEFAVGEFARLFDSSAVRERITRFARDGALPRERTAQTGRGEA